MPAGGHQLCRGATVWFLLLRIRVRETLVRIAAAIALTTTPFSAGCASQQRTIEQQQEKLQSLAASTRLLVDDFLAGQVSPTYTRTAFEAIFAQVEQQRAVLAATPETLADDRGAALAQQAGALSRLIAQMQRDVVSGNTSALRVRADAIPLRPVSP